MLMHFEERIPFILQLGFDKLALPRLKAYIDLLWQTNEELNLISRKMTFAELIDNHVIDCLLALHRFPEKIKTVADFGTGGGLPGIIFAIQFPDIQFHLFEKSIKKQSFLQQCKSIAKNIKIHGEIPLYLNNIDLIVARGFKPLDVILDMSRNYYEKGGQYFLLKARLEKITEEISVAEKKFKPLQISIFPIKSPVLEVERHLVLVN